MDAERPDSLQGLEAVRDVHDGRLGELDGDLTGVEPELGEGALDLGDEAGVVELRGRGVDRDPEAASELAPSPRRCEGLPQNLAAERADQAGRLGDVDEVLGEQQAPLRDASSARALPRRRRVRFSTR